MSVHVSSWAWKQPVGDAGAKLVLLKLADQANDNGECWPSQKTLAEQCEMSLATVKRKLELLYKLGLVVAEQRTRDNGSKSTLTYRLIRIAQSELGVAQDEPRGSSPVSYPEPSLNQEGAKAPSPRDEIWDALEARFGVVVAKTNAHKRRNKAVADLKKLGATPELVRKALKAWERTFPGATVTDIALATHWPQLTAGARAGPATERCPECGTGGGLHIADCPVVINRSKEEAA